MSIDIVLSTYESDHLLDDIPELRNTVTQYKCSGNPEFLGFYCQSVMKQEVEFYDYFAYMEDDLVLNDHLFFDKLESFTQSFGDKVLALPHRYEQSLKSQVHKLYIDGALSDSACEPLNQKCTENLMLQYGNQTIEFAPASNPHSGCYFLSQNQLCRFIDSDFFLRKSKKFIGPLESAATLGICRSFDIYKCTFSHAHFLEIRHWGDDFIKKMTSVNRKSRDYTSND